MKLIIKKIELNEFNAELKASEKNQDLRQFLKNKLIN